jgi:hypothetical protein
MAHGDWKKRYDSLLKLVDIQQQKIHDLEQVLEYHKKNLVNCQSNLEINKQMLRDVMADHAAKEQNLSSEIIAIKKKLKELGHGDFR